MWIRDANWLIPRRQKKKKGGKLQVLGSLFPCSVWHAKFCAAVLSKIIDFACRLIRGGSPDDVDCWENERDGRKYWRRWEAKEGGGRRGEEVVLVPNRRQLLRSSVSNV